MLQAYSLEMASRRFGLLEADGHSGDDPRTVLLSQLDDGGAGLLARPGLMTTAEVDEHGREKVRQARERRAALADKLAGAPTDDLMNVRLKVPSIRDLLVRELDARLANARATETPFLERLTLFWSDVFTVSAERGNVGDYAGAFEREAIRPHILGRYSAMLASTATHTAMLNYLDNRSSRGPNSAQGRRSKSGINENLAREILELHTLGAEGGYAQADVEAFARVLSGWSRVSGVGAAGTWPNFNEGMHEPGPKTILGKEYRQDGPEQLVAVLDDLAAHPSTAAHVTGRLCRHFVGETCPDDVKAAVARAYRDSGGDLKETCRALVSAEGVSGVPPRRMRPPLEHLLVISRLLDWRPDASAAMSALKAVGQPFFAAPSPAGWPDGDDDWAAPGSLKRRFDLIYRISGEFEGKVDPREVAQSAFGPWLSPTLGRALERAPSGREGLALLLMSPEVLRR